MGLLDRDYMRIEWATRSYEDAPTSTPPKSTPAPYSPISPKSEPNASQAAGRQLSVPTGEASHSKSALDFDSILRKIQERGIDSLTDLERKWLITTSSDQQRKNTTGSNIRRLIS
jgi:hypothetical protein